MKSWKPRGRGPEEGSPLGKKRGRGGFRDKGFEVGSRRAGVKTEGVVTDGEENESPSWGAQETWVRGERTTFGLVKGWAAGTLTCRRVVRGG